MLFWSIHEWEHGTVEVLGTSVTLCVCVRVCLSVVVGVFAQDDEALEDGRDRDVLLCRQLGSLPVRQQHRRGVRLKTSDGFGFACLSHHIHSLGKKGKEGKEKTNKQAHTHKKQNRRV